MLMHVYYSEYETSSASNINVNVNLSIALRTFLSVNLQTLNKKLELMGRIMNYFSKKLLNRENFSSMVPWATCF